MPFLSNVLVLKDQGNIDDFRVIQRTVEHYYRGLFRSLQLASPATIERSSLLLASSRDDDARKGSGNIPRANQNKGERWIYLGKLDLMWI